MKRYLLIFISILFSFSTWVFADDENVIDGELPSRYSSVEEGYVPAIKNQYGTGTCWTFASNACVEISALKEGLGSYNLSEKHMEYSLVRFPFTDETLPNLFGLNRELDSGGNSVFAAFYYFRFSGPVDRKVMPNTVYNNPIEKDKLPDAKPLLLIGNYQYMENSGCTTSAIEQIKNAVLEYGSASVSVYWDTDYISNVKYYYYNSSSQTNHAVNIVGWDDTVSKDSFSQPASRDGAWLVRNSWGTYSGEKGYYYISYDDARVCKTVHTFNDISENDYDYGYASTMGVYNMKLSFSNSIYVASKFTKKGNDTEYLDRVSFFVNANNAYKVYLSLDNSKNDKSKWTLLGSGSSIYDGIKTITFDKIEINSDYTVIIEFSASTASFNMSCNTKKSDDYNLYLNYLTNANFYSINGSTWTDLGSYKSTTYGTIGCAPIVYAYTKVKVLNPTFTIASFTPSKTYIKEKSDEYYTVAITTSDITDYSLFTSKIYNSYNEDVTSKFILSGSVYDGEKIIKITDGVKPGNYKYVLDYNGKTNSINFTVYSNIYSHIYYIENEYITIRNGDKKELTKKDIIDNLISYGDDIKITDSNNEEVTDNEANVGTNYNVIVNNENYKIILMGDISGDGKIKSNDALLISRYLVSLQTLNEAQMKAADISRDNQIKSNDALLISRFLVGLRTEL